jgi:chaperonin GroEL (HSP60 family)
LDQFGIWDRANCQVLVVDGFVEKVSEIDQILNAAFETKQPLVIVAHGFSEEVVSTLYLNRQKNLIDVIPLRVKQDVNNLNVINDIGISCGRDPISSLKGQMLVYVKPEDLPVVDRVRVTEQNTTIENPKSHRAVESQINMLLAKREDNRLVEDIQNIIDARIKSLIPNSVLLYLPEMSSLKNDTYRTRLDNAFRACKTLLNYGVLDGRTDFKDGMPISDNHLEKVIFDIVDKFMVDFDFFPTLSLFIGPLVVGKSILMLLSTAGLVEIDLNIKDL